MRWQKVTGGCGRFLLSGGCADLPAMMNFLFWNILVIWVIPICALWT
jgi:hypothetical protein